MFEGKIVSSVIEDFRQLKTQDEIRMQERRSEIYGKLPKIEQIEQTLRSLALEAAGAIFSSPDAGASVRNIGALSLELQAERSELLVEHGYPYDYLNLSFRCKKCSDSGFIGSEPCDCFNEACRRAQAKMLSSTLNISGLSFRSFKLDYHSDLPDPQYEVSPRENMKVNLQICRDFTSKFGKKPANLLLYGGPGLGKTMLSGCVAAGVIDRGFSVVYDTGINLLTNLESERFGRASDAQAEAIKRYFSCDLLILDDLGTEPPGTVATSSLYNVINTRLMKNAAMVVNTNLNIDELASRYSPQIHSRIAGEFTPLFFFGEDIRLAKKR